MWPHLNGITFPETLPGKVMILIGADVPEAHWTLEERRGRTKEPVATRTVLGWTLVGPTEDNQSGKASVHFVNDKQTVKEII